MSKVEHLQNRIRKLEKLLTREMAKNTILVSENKRLVDGSLVEYYKNKYFKLRKEHVQLQNEITITKLKDKEE